MGTLKQKLDYLKQTKEEIKNAIVSRGLTINNEDTFRSYASMIRSIPTDFVVPEGMKFGGSTLVDAQYMDISKLTNTQEMFQMCTYLKNVPLLDFSNVVEMGDMFNGCASLEELPPLNTAKATIMVGAFSNCPLLKKIGGLDFSSIELFNHIFDGSPKIAFLNIKNLGKSEKTDSYDFSMLPDWGDDTIVPGSRQSLNDTLLNNSFNRKEANYSTVTISLNEKVYNSLHDNIITEIESKGYTIM